VPQLKPPFDYLILGAGRQGTAAAYDLARFGAASRIVLADQNSSIAKAAAERVNSLVEREVAAAEVIDVADSSALRAILGPADVALSAVPYYFNLEITRAAIDAQTHLCDMGGHTNVVMTQLALDDEARQAGISIVPDCGMGPGLINTMGALAVELLDQAQEVFIYDAGLPQNPIPPWNYQLTFHINGLTNEMDGQAVFLRNGKITRVNTLTEPEFIEFPPLGRLEADVTSGGTSTAPWTFEGKLKTYENKVLRYPGHFEWLRAYKALGLFSERGLQVGQQTVIPRQVYHALLEPKISAPHIEDICVVRSVGKGLKDGQARQVTIDLVDYYDPQTGFTAMERLTGWHCAIMMIFQAHGEVRPGGIPMETAIPASKFMAGFSKRGIKYQIQWD
jgi:lysine 6-dehydrogenase